MVALRAGVASMLLLAATAAGAQLLESVVMPGKVIAGHAKYETQCERCHKRFDKAAQAGLCLECHKPVAADVRDRRGYHGRAPEAAGKPCRACHTEHAGREARIVVFDPRKFDHAVTGFALRGGHARPSVECRSCHDPVRKYREAVAECHACHARDDKHKGGLGKACGDCHTEDRWNEARFDHSKTRFALQGRHSGVKCASCHQRPDYRQAPRDCNGCHRKDDAHKGRYGPKCESCHDTGGWKSRFRHEVEARFALRSRHAALKCASCHKGDLYRDKVATTCVGCHRADDVHRGSQGQHCAKCHGENDWKAARFDHDATRFKLLGKHRGVKCESCHRPGADRRDVGRECVSCHRKDDAHGGQEGEKCGSCHGQSSWGVERYDHSRSRFPLAGAHFRLECKSCHASFRFREARRECMACHAKDDRHKGALGAKCADCHNTRAWTSWDFDHGRTAFPLEGRHRGTPCAACHVKAAAGKAAAPKDCASCHARDDTHAGAFGARCERCHVAESWRRIRPGMGGPPAR